MDKEQIHLKESRRKADAKRRQDEKRKQQKKKMNQEKTARGSERKENIEARLLQRLKTTKIEYLKTFTFELYEDQYLDVVLDTKNQMYYGYIYSLSCRDKVKLDKEVPLKEELKTKTKILDVTHACGIFINYVKINSLLHKYCLERIERNEVYEEKEFIDKEYIEQIFDMEEEIKKEGDENEK